MIEQWFFPFTVGGANSQILYKRICNKYSSERFEGARVRSWENQFGLVFTSSYKQDDSRADRAKTFIILSVREHTRVSSEEVVFLSRIPFGNQCCSCGFGLFCSGHSSYKITQALGVLWWLCTRIKMSEAKRSLLSFVTAAKPSGPRFLSVGPTTQRSSTESVPVLLS